MARYIILINWTDQGIKGYKDTVRRAADATGMAGKMGGSFNVYWTLGSHDIVAIAEFPDDEAATAFLLRLSSLGNIRTQSMRAFDSREMQAIVARTN